MTVRLAAYLAAERISASALARKLNVPPSTICRILRGSRSPTMRTVAKIAQATDGAVAPHDLLPSPAEENT